MSRLCGACIVDCDSVVFVISYSKLAFSSETLIVVCRIHNAGHRVPVYLMFHQ